MAAGPARSLVIVALLALATSATAASTAMKEGDGHADVCFEVALDGLSREPWEQVATRVTAAMTSRTMLFPAPSVEIATGPVEGSATPSSGRLGVHSGHAGGSLPGAAAPCLQPDLEWTARFSRAFLEASARRMLEEAPTTPGIASAVTLEWYPLEERVRTLLTFAGPLDIPNGRCWVDDVLTVDPVAGIVLVSTEQGLETSPFAEGACGRFFSHLPDGGAGEQAVTLLPAEIVLDDGAGLRFEATEVRVEDDAIVIGGLLESLQPVR